MTLHFYHDLPIGLSLKVIELFIGLDSCRIAVVYPVLVCQSFLLGYSMILSVGVIELLFLTASLVVILEQNIHQCNFLSILNPVIRVVKDGLCKIIVHIPHFQSFPMPSRAWRLCVLAL